MSVYEWEVGFIEWMNDRYGFAEPLVYVDSAVITAKDDIFESQYIYSEGTMQEKKSFALQNPPGQFEFSGDIEIIGETNNGDSQSENETLTLDIINDKIKLARLQNPAIIITQIKIGNFITSAVLGRVSPDDFRAVVSEIVEIVEEPSLGGIARITFGATLRPYFYEIPKNAIRVLKLATQQAIDAVKSLSDRYKEPEWDLGENDIDALPDDIINNEPNEYFIEEDINIDELDIGDIELTDAQFARVQEILNEIPPDDAPLTMEEIWTEKMSKLTLFSEDESIPIEDIMTLIGLEVEAEGEAVAGLLDPIFLLLNVIALAIAAYIIYIRLRDSYASGGMLLPMYPAPWLFDWTKLLNEPVGNVSDYKPIYDHSKLKNNFKKYCRNSFKKWITDNKPPLLQNKYWKFGKLHELIIFKRDPRLDKSNNSWYIQALNPKNIAYHVFEGYIIWKQNFDPPIEQNAMEQVYWNIVHALATMANMKVKYDNDANLENLLQYNPYKYRKHYNIQLYNWNAHQVSGHEFLGVGNAKYDYVEWNSGINITLIGADIAFYRMLFGLPLRAEDLWYLLVPHNQFWNEIRHNEYELMTRFVPLYGEHRIKLIDDLPTAAGDEDPARYWQLDQNDVVSDNSNSDIDEDFNVIDNSDDYDYNDDLVIL